MAKVPSISAEWAERFSSLLGDQPPKQADQPPKPADGSSRPVVPAAAVELLMPEEMAEADRRTISAGTPGIKLMERAGEAVAASVRRRVSPGSRIAVLAGPGNNGGDGFAAATILAGAGYLVVVGLLGDRRKLKGDAALAARDWAGPTEHLTPAILDGADLIVDALFGAGLDRPIEGTAAVVISAANENAVPVISVDLPSGISGRDGGVLGVAILAEESVTFFRKKPGHLLMPGRMFAGRVSVADIGIDHTALEALGARRFHNVPELWASQFPRPRLDGHKYDRGHTLVLSGSMTRTGAARLAARGALRVGSGLVTIAAPRDALPVNAAHLTAIMILQVDEADGLADILKDKRLNSIVLGPALGVGANTIALVETALASETSVVLDADALTSFSAFPDKLFERIRARRAPTILTPHDGEFASLFPGLARKGAKLECAGEAAALAGAIIVAKGPDTIVASPNGMSAIADNAPPDLATAGAGDVLAGIIGGLLAQRMPAFEAAAAGVWLHGAAALKCGRGLIAEDLPEALPTILGGITEASS